MSERINRAAGGVLQLLDIKSGGVTPNLLLETCQPSIDMARLYGQQQIEVETETDGGLAPGGPDTTTLNVPVGERWLIWSVAGRLIYSSGAAGSAIAYLRAEISGANLPLTDSQVYTVSSAVSESTFGTGFLTYPLILQGGNGISLKSNDRATATMAQTLYVLKTVLGQANA